MTDSIVPHKSFFFALEVVKIICMVSLTTFLFVNCQKNNTSKDKLNNTVEKHFKALQNRDLELLLETVNKEKITLILPNGQYSNSYDSYKEINKNWFSEKEWSIDYEIVNQDVINNTGIILAKIIYSDKDELGNSFSFSYYLTLIFENKPEGWKLIFDQNTIIK